MWSMAGCARLLVYWEAIVPEFLQGSPDRLQHYIGFCPISPDWQISVQMVMIDMVPFLLILTKEVLTKACELSGLKAVMTA